MNSLVLILGLAAVAMSGVAMLALRRAREAGALCVNLELLILDADQRLADMQTEIARLTKLGKNSAYRIDRLAVEQGRVAPDTGREGFGEAIALIEHGASAEELIDTCGLSLAEARLVATLYGNREPEVIANAPNKFVLIDCELDAAESRQQI